MNILIIGNGFDLAHGLPTEYSDFLEFLNSFKNKYYDVINNQCKTDIFKFLQDDISKELYTLIDDNLWFSYFDELNIDKGWVDFEKEISQSVQLVDYLRTQKDYNELDEEVINLTSVQIKKLNNLFYFGNRVISQKDYDNYKVRLLSDLNRLTRALEIYLSFYVNNIKCKDKLNKILELHIDKVLSFNYTNTFERFYGNEKVEYDYIHGKASCESSLESCNLVLGIDEYLKGIQKDDDNEFIEFKKFYQRIYKMTGCKYIDWLEQLDETNDILVNKKYLNVYIYGHSLDITDKDILSQIINYKYATTTIFYHNKKSLSKLIANLVKLIGENNLINKVHGHNASIIFKCTTDS